jgi:predicted RNA polymerase sigma factor
VDQGRVGRSPHARTAARLDAQRAIVLLEYQDRRLWDQAVIAEPNALLQKALRHQRPGPYQVQAATARVTLVRRAPKTPTGPRSTCIMRCCNGFSRRPL